MELRQVKIRMEKGTNYIMDGVNTNQQAKYAMGKFHCWEQYKNDEYSRLNAIVEFEDSRVMRFDAEDIQFFDNLLQAISDSYCLMD